MEGLAYLTLDADVKDDFVQDIPALQAMFELAKVSVALTLASGKIYWIQSHRAYHQAWNIGPLYLHPGYPLFSLCKPRLVISFLALIFPDYEMGSQLFMPSRQWEDEQEDCLFSQGSSGSEVLKNQESVPNLLWVPSLCPSPSQTPFPLFSTAKGRTCGREFPQGQTRGHPRPSCLQPRRGSHAM